MKGMRNAEQDRIGYAEHPLFENKLFLHIEACHIKKLTCFGSLGSCRSGLVAVRVLYTAIGGFF